MSKRKILFLIVALVFQSLNCTKFNEFMKNYELEGEENEEVEELNHYELKHSVFLKESKDQVIFDQIASDTSKTTLDGAEKSHYVSITPNLKLLSFSLIQPDESEVKYDYYHFKASGWITPVKKKAKEFVLTWDIGSIDGLDLSDFNDVVTLEAITPQTQVGSAKVTTTLSVKISAKLTYPGGETGGELGWSEAKERIVKDMEVGSYVRSFMPGWKFLISDKRSSVARTGFNYDCEWIWKINRKTAIDKGIYTKDRENYHFELNRFLKAKWFSPLIRTQKDTGVTINVSIPDAVVKGYVNIDMTEKKGD